MSYIKLYTIVLFSLPSTLARTCDTRMEMKIPQHKNLNQVMPDNVNPPPPPPTLRPRNRCCPYDFDSTLCRVIDDRVLCGYNLNVGQPKSKNNRIDLNGGCRLRGGRLECGYEFPPFTNSRRPPVWNEQHSREIIEDLAAESIKEKGGESGEGSDGREKLKFIVRLTTQKPRGSVTRCIEIRERIVCKQM